MAISTTRFIRRRQPELRRRSRIIAPRRRGFALTRHFEEDRRRAGGGSRLGARDSERPFSSNFQIHRPRDLSAISGHQSRNFAVVNVEHTLMTSGDGGCINRSCSMTISRSLICPCSWRKYARGPAAVPAADASLRPDRGADIRAALATEIEGACGNIGVSLPLSRPIECGPVTGPNTTTGILLRRSRNLKCLTIPDPFGPKTAISQPATLGKSR